MNLRNVCSQNMLSLTWFITLYFKEGGIKTAHIILDDFINLISK